VDKMKSYTSRSGSALSFLREVSSLYRYARQASDHARQAVEDIRRREAIIREHLGLELRDLNLLEIGPGQYQAQSRYLALNNRVVGIDLDVIAAGLSPSAYFRMLRSNGVRRAAKTLGRKLLGFDREFERELQRQLGVRQLPILNIMQMDACHMSFADESFDFVYTRSVFHHLPDPSAALDGIVRILRPGGAAYVALHVYSSHTGCLDPRIYTAQRDEIRGWPHLRPALCDTINKNTYVNKLRLQEWRTIFDSKMPGGEYFTGMADTETTELARALQSQGELRDYSLEELTTNEFAALWRKPASRVSSDLATMSDVSRDPNTPTG
jgi:SAM-dependent methyltransferase